MNVDFLRKRNQSLQWMLACAAVMDTAIWMLSSSFAHVPYKNGFVLLVLGLVLFGMGFPVIVLYTLACENYLRAKDVKKASDVAIIIAFGSLLTSSFAAAFAALCGYVWTIHFILPAVFGLAALPLRLMRDRS